MQLSLISAMSENRAIGLQGRLPWPHLPNDWANFFAVTKDSRMIMGRKSYDTPDRLASEVGNFVITRQEDYVLEEGFTRAGSLQEALEACKNDKEVFVIGGAEIYRQALPLADIIHLTVVHGIFEGDAFFPEFSESEFKLKSRQDFPADAQHAYAYSFLVYEKTKNP
ncbi:dihydrofolate reductase [Runella sp. CRIBMP]|uniref:dihydrofolate reductase n=1 Tax=Runella sp. CRIBMP TaxID=2683261 RepID=UPI00141331FC|nr:dihydrofolate reductase [Runella sp. CRIBMP]NBB19059.1 dihydrofolate reductase [Runella sp. CRIBMP]